MAKFGGQQKFKQHFILIFFVENGSNVPVFENCKKGGTTPHYCTIPAYYKYCTVLCATELSPTRENSDMCTFLPKELAEDAEEYVPCSK